MEKSKTKLQPGDFIFVTLTLLLVIFGVIMVFSASYYSAINSSGNPYYYLFKETFFAVTGFIVMIAAAILDYRKLKKGAPWIMLICVLLLIIVITPVGMEVNGARRWINLGLFTLMPGEIAKVGAIIFVAWFLSKKPDRITSFIHGVLPLLILIGFLVTLVMMQPNMSTAMTLAGIILIMMFVAGMKYKHLGGLVIISVVSACALIFSDSDGYRLKRVTSFMDPFKDAAGDGYQVVQSLLALGSGGIFGVGLGKSVQKTLYLPEPQNDFILAIIGEELGFIGILVLLIVYLLLIWRGIKIALEAPDRFGMLLATGITVMIGLQVVLNVAVVTSSMPATGVILPFVSYGGTALWLFMFEAGVLINISRHTRKKEIE